MDGKNDFFWPSYTDLMTSMFFVMLTLFVLVYVKQHIQIDDLERKLAIITTVEENLRPLKNDHLFTYQADYKRFKLSFDVQFKNNRNDITIEGLENYYQTTSKISDAGRRLKSIIDGLLKAKLDDPAKLKDISYIVVIAGYASRTGEESHNYNLSYLRALSLRNYWKSIGIDFEHQDYAELVDLQISGNGWGGIGREKSEPLNQRFLIQIFPKIGDVK